MIQRWRAIWDSPHKPYPAVWGGVGALSLYLGNKWLGEDAYSILIGFIVPSSVTAIAIVASWFTGPDSPRPRP